MLFCSAGWVGSIYKSDVKTGEKKLGWNFIRSIVVTSINMNGRGNYRLGSVLSQSTKVAIKFEVGILVTLVEIESRGN